MQLATAFLKCHLRIVHFANGHLPAPAHQFERGEPADTMEGVEEVVNA